MSKSQRSQNLDRNKLCELASRSFEQKVDNLAVSMDVTGAANPGDGKYKEGTVNGENFTFVSVGVRDELAAEHYFKADSAAGIKAKWIDRAFEIRRRENRRSEGVLDNYLRFVCGKLDIIREAARAIEQKKERVFGILDFVRTALPHVQVIKPTSLIALTEAQHEQIKGDGARGVFLNALETHIKTDIRKLEEVINSVRPKLNDANATLYRLSLISLAIKKPSKATDIALKDALSKKPKDAEVSVWALGRLLALSRVPKQKRKKAISQLRSSLSHSKSDVRRSAIAGIAECVLSSPELEQDFKKMLLNENIHAYRALSAIMWQQSAVALAHPNFEDWLLYLTKLPISEYGALDHVDLVLSECLDAGASETVLKFYTGFLETKSANEIGKKDLPSLFKTSFHKLLEDKNLRDRLITEWLGCESRSLVVGVEAVLGELQLHKLPRPEFCSNTVDKFDDAALILAFKRMLGVVLYSEQYMSLVFSLFKVKRAEKRTYHHIEDILKNEVGLDYPGDTIKYCKTFCKRRKSGEVFELCNRVVASIEAYMGALRQLPDLSELKPSQKLLEKTRAAQTETMQRAQKSAEESSLVSLFTRIPLKAGRATFSYHGDAYQAPSGLHSFEHTVSFPRQHSLDSVGYEISRLIYRASKRGVR